MSAVDTTSLTAEGETFGPVVSGDSRSIRELQVAAAAEEARSRRAQAVAESAAAAGATDLQVELADQR